jgi:hypothetical protein
MFLYYFTWDSGSHVRCSNHLLVIHILGQLLVAVAGSPAVAPPGERRGRQRVRWLHPPGRLRGRRRDRRRHVHEVSRRKYVLAGGPTGAGHCTGCSAVLQQSGVMTQIVLHCTGVQCGALAAFTRPYIYTHCYVHCAGSGPAPHPPPPPPPPAPTPARLAPRAGGLGGSAV